MPHLRIISDELWGAVKLRQQEIHGRSVKLREILNNPKTRSHSGKYLFSGLLQCGCCGANFTIYSTTSYACATNINRGSSACGNKLRAPRKLVEQKLLEAIRHDLLSEDSIDLFVEETSKILRERGQQPKSEAAALRRSVTQTEKQITNIMNAIKAGIITPMTKAELERAEAEHGRAKEALAGITEVEEVLTVTLPDAAQRYKRLVADLGKALQTDIGYARECLKSLLGAVKLVPASSGGFLEAELHHNPDGLMRLALQGDFGLKARVVAGAGFEPAAFRL